MFDFDNLREIWGTIRKNKLRTFLTGFSVAWGIFMLIALLGAGNGLRNGIMSNFDNMSSNQFNMYPGYTTKAWQGMQPNRSIKFTDRDFQALRRDNPEVDLASASVSHSDTLYYNFESMSAQMEAVYPDLAAINHIKMETGKGRFINNIDIHNRRKCIVISPRMAEVLFPHTDPLGKYVKAGSEMLEVVGIYQDKYKSNNSPAYIPFSTGQALYNSSYGIDEIVFTAKGITSKVDNDAFEKRVRGQFARRLQFDPTDDNAIGMYGTFDDFRTFNLMMNAITIFIWIVGIGTLMAGIVGVSNIMLITVRERRKEFGIRKALGAKPSSILSLIILESIMVTAIFGYIGMLLGIGVTELINYIMEMSSAAAQTAADAHNEYNPEVSIFKNPTVSLGISLAATLVIVIAGVIAGYFPARKALKVPAIEAIRSEE